jgi:hypothetical protein
MNVYNDRVYAEEIADWDKFRKITTKIYSAGHDRSDYRVYNAVLLDVFNGVDPIKLLSCVGSALEYYEY